ncbi:Fasciclin-domain-containing protein [Delitschia confertaspora ATCC 74209]|uniref:Fasciclin-domain-containing protein n=1 Tax=Delitschia confertaspora ATCC 74209 TaxID=1513339 RepID=A0A9P4MT85_9PLEO|nr:Fasciclin-domain-containing protein [Delitschia confertaspora ATCC 74209]
MQLKHLLLSALFSLTRAQSNSNLSSLLSSTSQLSQLTSILNANPSLLDSLNSAKDITILAPNDDAFKTLLATNSGKAVAADTGMLTALLTYHVLNGTYMAADLSETPAFVSTLLTNETYSNVTGGQVVKGLRNGDNTMFFSGLGMNSSVVQANIKFTGGVVHILNAVLTLPLPVSTTATASNLTALAGALSAANLGEMIDTMPDVTIFAPNNEAFQSIASGLANLSTSDLTDILGYHVVNGTVGYSSMLESGMRLKTVEGGEVTVTIDGSNVFVNGAKVIIPDVLVANGVVHVVDNILNPSVTTARPSPSDTTGAPAFSGSSASNVPFTSGQPTPTMAAPGSESSGPAMATGAATSLNTGAMGAMALFGVVGLMNY